MKDKYVYVNGKADGVPALNDKIFYMNEKTDGLPVCRWNAGKKYKPMDCRFADGLLTRNIKLMDCWEEKFCLQTWKADGVPALNDKDGYMKNRWIASFPMDCRHEIFIV